MSFLRQTWTLVCKNFLIVLARHGFATTIRAFVLPIILTAFLSFARNLFVPPAVFGISDPHPVRSLRDALDASSGVGRDTLVFVNNGFSGGQIERVIDGLVPVVTAAGRNARVLESDADLNEICRASLRGVTPCYGAVIFHASPDEGRGGLWNYTIRSDSSLGLGRINVEKDTNDAELYMLPFQHAIDAAITSSNEPDSGQEPLTNTTSEYAFTDLTREERADWIRVRYQQSLVSFLGVAFIAGMIGIAYHMAGFMASEREIGMSTLVDATMPAKYPWMAQAARLWSYHVSFSVIYLPGWVIGAIILGRGVFAHTNVGIVIIYHILAGLALASMTIFGAAFFRKAQLSGVTLTIAFIVLAIIAQTITSPGTGTVTVLSLLFAPSNYTYFITYLARWEQHQRATNLTEVAPTSPWSVSGIVLWVFLVLQIIVYPVLGAFLERWLHGTSSNTRNIVTGDGRDSLGADTSVRLEGFTKIYKPGLIRRMFSFVAKPKDPVVAVNGLTLSAGRGQILVLLGANGSGKSTTLDSIAGISKPTSGHITIDGTGGLGIAPQKNVLWDELTVAEHIKIFNKLKSPGKYATKQEIGQLVAAIDLEKKIKAQSKTLSGGQKRKLQLGMMLTGGSAVCCVDEVSSGLDPLSRRKIWDILLAERGQRTIIMTTHFLDEADLLADHIAVLSKGTLRAEGASVELKDRLGGGYRIHVQRTKDLRSTPDVDGVTKKTGFDIISYIAPSSSLAALVIKNLESEGITDYRFSGPTIEDVFLQLAEEIRAGSDPNIGEPPHTGTQTRVTQAQSEKTVDTDEPTKEGLELLPGRRIGYIRQTGVLLLKRCVVFKNNWLPYAAAFVVPIIAAGLVSLFIRDQKPAGCNPSDQVSKSETNNLFDFADKLFLVGGPSSKFDNDALSVLLPVLLGSAPQNSSDGSGSGGNPLNFLNNLTLVDSFDEFTQTVKRERKNVNPAGLWLGDSASPPTIAFNGYPVEMYSAWFGQSILDMLLTNTSIASTYKTFDSAWAPNTGNSLQLLVYIGLALSAYPAFFALYPNVERRSKVRGLQYSNGVRTMPLWLAYILFDFSIIVVSTAVVTILFATLSSVWYHVAYLFPIFMLYGLASTLLGYLISLFCGTQLSTYAFTAAGQAVMFLVYLIAYLSTITFGPVNRIDDYLLVVHFVVSAFAPIGSVMRSLLIALNLFSATCVDKELAPNPAGILQYGGPILYLVVQSILLFGLIIWLDSDDVGSYVRQLFQRRGKAQDNNPDVSDEEVANEQLRVINSVQSGGSDGASSATTDGLRVVHLTKRFGKNTAVDNVSLGVKRGEVFALLGPNGAGKSTTISLIRGDIKPSVRGGDIFVDNVSVTKNLAAARAHLGVCPQFDAIDQMTVTEHLRFYARVRGIPDIDHNVDAILRAVGLTAFRDRQAHALSGGNKRKLSLGIALMGDPAVLLLDEPSSGLDAAAKRIMWRTLAATVPGRSILLTTHSMEEADALAGRAGILAKRMLAMGTVDRLRRRFGDALHVHLVCKGAPRTSDEDVARVRDWVVSEFPDALVEERTYHGQMRFSVPATAHTGSGNAGAGVAEITRAGETERSAIGQLVVTLEENRERLGVQHYSVSPTTLDQVFLTVVGRHGVKEEGYGEEKKKKWWR